MLLLYNQHILYQLLPQRKRFWQVSQLYTTLHLESLYFFYLGFHANFQNPRTTPFGRKETRLEEREEERKKRHYALPAMPKSNACTSLGPILVILDIEVSNIRGKVKAISQH